MSMANTTMTPEKREAGQWETMKRLLPYLWPVGRWDLRSRVIIAMALLVLSKVVTVLTPYSYKWATDALTATSTPAIAGVTAAVFMVLAYGVGRMFMVVFAQMRDAIFAKVGQRTVREMSSRTFRHLHDLSLSYHLSRGFGFEVCTFQHHSHSTGNRVCLCFVAVVIRVDLCVDDRPDGGGLHLVHICSNRMAHCYSPRHERGRSRCWHQSH
jgi:ABC-type multidrug transport system fused ATPase/permease subunit